METIKPIEIDVNTLTIDSNLDSDAYYDRFGIYNATINAYNPTTSYSLGNLMHFQTKVYQSILNGSNTGNNPITGNTNLATGLNYWNLLGTLNKFSAFDIESNTQSIGLTSNITFSFIPTSTFTAIAFTNIEVDQITVSVVDPLDDTNIFHTETKSPLSRNVSTWEEWITTPFPLSSGLLFSSIPAITGAKVLISAYKEVGVPKIGGITIGRLYNIGALELGVRLLHEDYSIVTRDEFGTTKLVKRNNYSGIDGYLRCDASKANLIRDLKKTLTATPTVFIGVAGQENYYYNSLFMLGVCTMEQEFDTPTEFRVKLNVKEI